MTAPRHAQKAPIKKRILVLDDHPMTRYGLVQLINGERDLVVHAEAGDVRQALASLQPPLPDLVLADISLSGKSGLEFIKDLQELHPSLPVLVLSMHDERVYAERVLRAGGRGYIMKSEGGEKLLRAISMVLAGRIYVSEGMSAAIIDTFANRRSNTPETSLSVLTDREFEVFQLLGRGLSTREISEQLCISIPTIGTHRMNIKKKLALESGAALVQYAVRWAATQNVI